MEPLGIFVLGQRTVEAMGLIWETDTGLPALDNFSLWLMGSKVTTGPPSELSSEASFTVE